MPRSHLLDRDQLLARQAFQLRLVDTLRHLDRAEDIMRAAAEALGRYLGVARCGYGEIAEDGAVIHVTGDWTPDPSATANGETHALGAFAAPLFAELLQGRTVVVEDCCNDPRTSDRAAEWAEIQTRTMVVFPLSRHGALVAIFYVHDPEPRFWDHAEIALVEDVALRTADAVERVRAEAASKESEGRYRSLFNSIDAGFCVVEMRFAADGTAEDYRFIEVNDGFVDYTGLVGATGRWVRELIPAHEQYWFDRFGAVARTGEHVRFEDYAGGLDRRWYDVHAYRVGAPELHHVAVLFTDITERRRAEIALQQSREELELATRAARLGRFDYRPQTGTLTWDDRCRELFGLPPGVPVDYEGSFLSRVHPDDRAATQAAVDMALDPDGPRGFDIEYRVIAGGEGIERHLLAHGIVFFDGRLPIRMIGTVFDLTRDRQAQAALVETGERLRLAGRATNDAIWDWDLRRDQVLWNEALERSYGHVASDVEPTGAWWIGQIHPDDRARVDASIHALIDGDGSDWTDEYRFARADGSYADILDRGYVIRDASGAAIRMIGAMLDQSARKAVERQLRAVNERLAETVETATADRNRLWDLSGDIMLRATFDGTIVAANPAWTAMLGWDLASILQRPLFDLLHPDDRHTTAKAAAGLARGETIGRIDNRYRHRDGSYRWISWAARPGDGLINAVGRDITEEKEREVRLARAEDALRQAQKMEAVGQLTGGIAHDFNNMLTGIIGGLDMIRRNLPEARPEKVDRYLSAASVSAQRAAGLTQRLLAFSRRQSLDVVAVDLGQLVDGMEDLLRRTLGETIEMEVLGGRDLWRAKTDANQLESALLNLAINARDAMPDGGRLTIETSNAHLDAAYTDGVDEELEPGDYLVVAVSDTGTGMSEAVIAKAFDPFFTTKPIGQGTGLGLSMIYGFAHQSGGHVRIRSEEGKGTTITLYLPRFRGSADAATAVDRYEPLPRARGESVLVVEDDSAVRMLIVDVLDGLGYRVIEAWDGPAALPILASDTRIDLLVSDVGLPGMSGREVAEIARQYRPRLKVLFVTGYAEQAAVRGEFLGDDMEMITKPFPIDLLAARISALIGGG
ncbi:PAS domain S-box protein [Sphingomonas ginsenosidivorax]|uniref:histidine kinase n=1 Tax=Sphingomonas ginsenosidivorax TaxID=862135 RepID=A0A5C6UBU3_9SPHN|nr:PAS domain-containing protein [Sphingomonas ginsenosidivorax]TXC69910.1 PAS domain S-box protein [Sphingomonas ginsenosidivorax]